MTRLTGIIHFSAIVTACLVATVIFLGSRGGSCMFSEADGIDRFQELGGQVEHRNGDSSQPVDRAWIGPKFQGDISRSMALLPSTVEVLFFDQSRLSDSDLAALDLSHFNRLGVLGMNFCAISGRHLARLAPLPSLAWLAISGTNITNKQMSNINQFSQLTMLSLDQCHISDQGLSELKLPDLATLSLRSTEITENVVSSLRGCPKIIGLVLTDTAVSDKTLEMLPNRAKLLSLHLKQTGITDAGISFLSDAKALRVLHLDRTKITDSGLIHLRNCRYLRQLTLSGLNIGGDGLIHLTHLDNLTLLDLSDTRISDRAMEFIRSLKGLQQLKLRNCPSLTATAVQRFKKARPGVTVVWGIRGEPRVRPEEGAGGQIP